MREIKYRAWDSVEKQMTYWDFYDKKILDDNIYDVHSTIIMQYTGLKDKNGVEVYEGDYVGMRQRDMRYASKEDYSIYTVYYDNNQGMFGYKNRNGDIVRRKTGNVASISFFSKPIVLGNKYENLELLEKQNEK
jgi:uncharacterized phage protein (TIGR01671 family)